MQVINKIEELRKNNRYSYEQLSEKIGMTKMGLHGALKNGDIKLSILIKISEIFQVPITYFFDESTETNENMNNITIGGNNVNNNKVIIAKKHTDAEIEKLRIEIESLKKEIDSLKENNKLLIEDKKFLQNLINGGNKNAVFFDKQQ